MAGSRDWPFQSDFNTTYKQNTEEGWRATGGRRATVGGAKNGRRRMRGVRSLEQPATETFRRKDAGSSSQQGGAGKSYMASRDSRQSYKDKLLCLGESGFLELNISVANALNGWKEYFARTNEKQNLQEEEDGDEGNE